MPAPRRHISRLYYSIGEVAEILNVNTSLIRHWEKEFDSIKPRKTRKGNRMFTAEDIEQLKFLHHLVKEQGHTLDGARKIMARKNGDPASKFELISTLEELKSFLTRMRDEL
jgi:DNA-binding transcriptional MerR regulator